MTRCWFCVCLHFLKNSGNRLGNVINLALGLQTRKDIDSSRAWVSNPAPAIRIWRSGSLRTESQNSMLNFAIRFICDIEFYVNRWVVILLKKTLKELWSSYVVLKLTSCHQYHPNYHCFHWLLNCLWRSNTAVSGTVPANIDVNFNYNARNTIFPKPFKNIINKYPRLLPLALKATLKPANSYKQLLVLAP